ncbi:PepSY domain-containing protein [Azospirillum sp. RWY-5-1]|uniref:PepSY domain-containing protein n=1 Tax=Azospirillum oleiclasticum TaxID=2735135 RepID=A0ABX2TG57_9PROT|nr:PepSY-associated TM helix domain-containing protein [Azospirillum oleiclasticum]NYZ14336.1 PepSY domain-containing protein [Azospirillum oleiclasticum]NYZ23312.1 PepSY domain-containing protein [Azospirillum oleiclasticum]
MVTLTRAQMKRLTAVHGWSGTILGLLLYAVIVTGTVVVLGDEIGAWSAGGIRTDQPIVPGIDTRVRPIIEAAPAEHRTDITVFANARGELLVFPHADIQHPDSGEPEPYGTLFRLDPVTGGTLSRHEGFVFREPAWHEASALQDFLVDLHVQLHVPPPWGLILTGVLGLLMVAMGVTGLLMHRHLVRDLFVPVRPGRRLVSARDRHVLAGSWALLFAFVLGFTGAYFSFAGTVVFPLLTEVAFGGDEVAAAEALFEPPVVTDARPAPLAGLDRVVADAAARAGSPVDTLSIERYGRADARIRTFHRPPPDGMDFVRTVYDGVSGGFLELRPVIGNQPSGGALLMGLMWPLHTGSFAGAPSKSIWVGLGSMMAFVVVSGMRLWLRRRDAQPLWQGFGRAVTIVGYGLPVAMLTAAHACFLAGAVDADAFRWTPAGFAVGVIPGVLPGLLHRDEDGARRLYRGLLGAGVVLLPPCRMVTGGIGWGTALYDGQGTVLSIDLALLVLGAALIGWAMRPETMPRPRSVAAE